MSIFAKSKKAGLLAAIAAGGLVLTPAFASSAGKKRPTAVSISADPIFAFTPANADPRAEPDWRQVSTQPEYDWHDHRTHWMSASPPPQVAADPES